MQSVTDFIATARRLNSAIDLCCYGDESPCDCAVCHFRNALHNADALVNDLQTIHQIASAPSDDPSHALSAIADICESLAPKIVDK